MAAARSAMATATCTSAPGKGHVRGSRRSFDLLLHPRVPGQAKAAGHRASPRVSGVCSNSGGHRRGEARGRVGWESPTAASSSPPFCASLLLPASTRRKIRRRLRGAAVGHDSGFLLLLPATIQWLLQGLCPSELVIFVQSRAPAPGHRRHGAAPSSSCPRTSSSRGEFIPSWSDTGGHGAGPPLLRVKKSSLAVGRRRRRREEGDAVELYG